MNVQDGNNIDRLKEDIYKRDFETKLPSASQKFTEENVDVGRNWQHDPSSNPARTNVPPAVPGSFFRKLFLSSVVFFVISAGLLVYMFFGGWNVISANNVDVTFLGPVSISAGNELGFEIVINNKNRSAIENAVLYINYPDGTKKVDDLTSDFTYETQNIGEILPGQSVRRTSRSVIFGELNSVKEIKTSLEYGLKNSSAKFRKEKNYEVSISSTPLSVSVSHPTEAASNDVVEFSVNITSNSSVALNNLLLKVDYPFGFSFVDSSLKPTYDNAYWSIDKLNPGESKTFTIKGEMRGEEGDERVLRFSIGAQNPSDPKVIATKYLTQIESVFLKKPPLALSLNLEDSSGPQFTTEQGTIIHGTVDVVNNLPVRLTNTKVELLFGGKLFDPVSVKSGFGGFYRSIDNTIVWEKNTLNQLASLEPGQKVSLVFSFATFPISAVNIQNGTMSLKASVTSNRIVENDKTQVISTSQSTTVLTQTSIGLLSRVVYSTGPFRNRGPIPPKADNKTTYTIIWTATNSLNAVRGAEARATLPPNVTWLGVTSPQSESISWNNDNNEVVWRIGDIVAGSGISKPAREVAFQVEFLPSLSQVDSIPVLVSAQGMFATDSFTNAMLSVSSKDLTTRLSTDPQFKGEEAKVVK